MTTASLAQNKTLHLSPEDKAEIIAILKAEITNNKSEKRSWNIPNWTQAVFTALATIFVIIGAAISLYMQVNLVQEKINSLDSNTQQRISSLDSNTQEKIKGLESTTTEKFNTVNTRLDNLEKRIDKVDEKLDKIDEKLDSIANGQKN